MDRPSGFDALNQSVVVRTPTGFDRRLLLAAVQVLLDHHDALRSRVRYGDGEPRLDILSPQAIRAEDWVSQVDAQGLDEEQLVATICEHAESARSRLSVTEPVTMQCVWFDRGPHRDGRLLLLAHHLVVDAVSWNILLGDLAAAADSAANGRARLTTPTSASFRTWAHRLARAAAEPERVAELPLWQQVLEPGATPVGARALDPSRDTVASTHVVRHSLAAEETRDLIGFLPSLFHAATHDVLLTGFAFAMRQWSATPATDVLLTVEGHGRDDVLGVDVSRTVGWFTCTHPVRLDTGDLAWRDVTMGGEAAGRGLKRIKEQLRRFADNGIGYGMLRHLNPSTGAVLADYAEPTIAFNYLGRSGGGPSAGDQPWTTAPEEVTVAHADAAMAVPHALDVGAFIKETAEGPRFTAALSAPAEVLSQAQLGELLDLWFAALSGIRAHAHTPQAGGHTPSDLFLDSLDQGEIDELEAELGAIE
jgi:non-ribosomal peptide synthase protein (TIGR01720 family)